MTDANTSTPSTGDKPRGCTDKVLVIGLDGATFDVLDPLISMGLMPRLAACMKQGTSAVLRSTTPPITPAAWTTFLTGKQPGSHGVIDFERYDATTNKLLLNSTQSTAHVRNLWQILSAQGLKVGSVNVPMTYPPVPVNGFVVSGFETPGPQSDFVYPKEIREEILQRWPDPTLKTNWRRSPMGGDRLFAENVDYMSRSFHQGADMTTWLGDKFGWDVLMVVFKLVDNLQHKTWKYLDPRWCDKNPKRRDIARACFTEADKAVGQLLDYADKHNATVVMVSDHGHGSLEGKIQPNLMLKDWGYLKLHGGGARGATRGKTMLNRLLGRREKFIRVDDIARDLAVDFSQTRACVMHAGMAGFLYLNLKGRQPTGIVDQADYESLRDELIERLTGKECQTIDPNGNTIPLFTEVHKPEQLWNCSREKQPWLPDLILTPYDGLAVVRKIRGSKAINWLPFRKLEGTHRKDGIFIASGPGVNNAPRFATHIVNCAPTILALLGQPIPDDMEGEAILDLFATPPTILKERSKKVEPAASRQTSDSDVFSDDDMKRVTERLADLGYLE